MHSRYTEARLATGRGEASGLRHMNERTLRTSMELRVLKHTEDAREPSWRRRLASLMLLRGYEAQSQTHQSPVCNACSRGICHGSAARTSGMRTPVGTPDNKLLHIRASQQPHCDGDQPRSLRLGRVAGLHMTGLRVSHSRSCSASLMVQRAPPPAGQRPARQWGAAPRRAAGTHG